MVLRRIGIVILLAASGAVLLSNTFAQDNVSRMEQVVQSYVTWSFIKAATTRKHSENEPVFSESAIRDLGKEFHCLH